METITSSPGLFHIAKKILSSLIRSDPANVYAIRNLRLTNVGWKSIIESVDMFKFWQKIYLSRKDEFPEQTFDLISILYKKAYECHDTKLMWLLSHYVMVTLEFPKSVIAPYRVNKYHEIYTPSKPIVFFLCNGPFEIVEAILKNIDVTKDLDIFPEANSEETLLILLKTAAMKYFRKDLVKLFCFAHNVTKLPASFTTDLVGLITTYDQYPTLKTKLIRILAFLMDTLTNTDLLVMKANSQSIKDFCLPAIKDYSGCKCINPMKNHSTTKNLAIQEKNILITALHYDVHYQNIGLIEVLMEPLRRAKFDMNTDSEVLEVINEYAALRGYLEIAKIVAEKMGNEAYADLAMDLMNNCIHWMDESVLKFMASIIDDQDVKKINNYEETSLHAAAKNGKMNYIINFAPFSSTSHEKDHKGKTALLLLIWDSKNDHSDHQDGNHGNPIREKAVKTLMSCIETEKVQKDFDELDFYDLEQDSDDDYYEDSEEDDSEVDENDIEESSLTE